MKRDVIGKVGRLQIDRPSIRSWQALSPCDDEAGQVCPMSIGKVGLSGPPGPWR